MLFIDGENFTFRAQEYAKAERLILERGPHYEPDVFVWMPTAHPEKFWYYCGPSDTDLSSQLALQAQGVRAHYYTSAVGSDEIRENVRAALWDLGFSPYVFKKDKQTSKTKGVDVTLTKDVLSHAYQNNYDAVFLVAGDGDYVPLVEEVKRRGKIVYVAFFGGGPEMGLSPELRLVADRFFQLNAQVSATWTPYLQRKNA